MNSELIHDLSISAASLSSEIRRGVNILIFFFRYPRQFLAEVSMSPDMFWWDVLALTVTVFTMRVAAFLLLKWKLNAVR